MRHFHLPGPGWVVPRPGFTAVELLLTIAILAALVSLIAAALMRTLTTVRVVQTRHEIAELELALEAFRRDHHNVELRSVLLLCEDNSYPTRDKNLQIARAAQLTVDFLKKAWGPNILNTPHDWNGNGKIDYYYRVTDTGSRQRFSLCFYLQGQQCLAFYLAGIPSPPGSPPAGFGFSTNRNDPAAPGGTRRGPYYDFSSDRQKRSETGIAFIAEPGGGHPELIRQYFGYLSCLDAWGQRPYAFFSTRGGREVYQVADCRPPYSWTSPDGHDWGKPVPYRDGTRWANPRSYQILSAGADLTFGDGTWSSAQGTTGAGRDDQANFSPLPLGDGVQ